MIEKKFDDDNKVNSIGPNNPDKVVSNDKYEQISFEVLSGGVIG